MARSDAALLAHRVQTLEQALLKILRLTRDDDTTPREVITTALEALQPTVSKARKPKIEGKSFPAPTFIDDPLRPA